jgi:hypothetical protein
VGQTLVAWTSRTQLLLRDSGAIDVDATLVAEVGVKPAIAQFSIDRPRMAAVDVTASARFLPFPTEAQGWIEGFSTVQRIEAPAGLADPRPLADGDWSATRDPANAAVARILIAAGVAGETCRIMFTSAWPTPTATAADDLIGSIGFNAVTSLAAAMVLTALSAEAARDRQGAMPTDFVSGSDRARMFLDAAAAQRVIYHTFIGLGSVSPGQQSGSRQVRSAPMGSAAKRLASTASATDPRGVPWT